MHRNFTAAIAWRLVFLAGLVAAEACGDDSSSSSAERQQATSSTLSAPAHVSQQPKDTRVNVVATAVSAEVKVFSSLEDPTPDHVLNNPTKDGGPLVFLVEQRQTERLKVLLPIRPNGSSGWVDGASVSLSQHDYRIEIRRSDHRLTVFKGNKTLMEVPVGIGTSKTPTPGGRFYVNDLIEAIDPTGPYGPYAFGLSGFSDQLESFNGGDGVIGIHGTNDPSKIGTDVSKGCIRMTNENITKLVGLLPLGTPVEILA